MFSVAKRTSLSSILLLGRFLYIMGYGETASQIAYPQILDSSENYYQRQTHQLIEHIITCKVSLYYGLWGNSLLAYPQILDLSENYYSRTHQLTAESRALKDFIVLMIGSIFSFFFSARFLASKLRTRERKKNQGVVMKMATTIRQSLA